jgi:radical SAM-linked protein
MPRPPGRKGTGVRDAVPPLGMSPGSAAARARRAVPVEPASAGVDETPAAEACELPDPPALDEAERWNGVFDTSLPREFRTRVEIRYGKRGALVHLGHLEVMGAFRRALRRTGAPVLWSKGFHPQMKLTFGLPLPSGMASEAEWADLELRRPVDVAALAAQLAGAMPEELPILEVVEVPSKRKAVAARVVGFDYRVLPPSAVLPAASEAAERYRSAQAWSVEVTRKSGPQEVELKGAGVTVEPEEHGGFRLGLRSDGAGARVRDALRAIFGDDAASGTAGWTVLRIRTRFRHDAARPATPADHPRPRRSS